MLRQGRRVYDKHCVSCHGENGEGVPRVYSPLAGTARMNSTNAVKIVLDGGYPPGTAGNRRPYGMPPFSAALSDADIAAVLSFINTSWGNKGLLVRTYEVDRVRNGD
ncbi:c-type cytochrome [Massilia glaciei]|uniref:c-type cytochrome n=1 Tax=Massilia glaciei TaxID=1524097 RepID=UPI0027D7DAC3|nr:cytochrome c [Massilia glaciei]